MARLLIVDDEPLILENLYVLFREETDMELEVYKADSAEKALAIMDDVAIDILITDIMMPGMTGLELQVKAIERLPNIKVIILTSYSDFSLIQAAQRKGSIDYVMKTEPDHVLLETVQLTIAMLDAEMLNRRRMSDLRSMQDELAQLNEMFYLTRFLETGSLQEREIPFCLRSGLASIVLTARTDSGRNAILAGSMGVAMFSKEMNAAYSLLANGCMVMFLQPKTGNAEREWSLVKQRASALCLHLQQGYEEDTGSRIAICISEQPIPPEGLRAQCYAQRRALEGADASALLTLGSTFKTPIDNAVNSRMEAILNAGDRGEYRRYLNELSARLEGAATEMQRHTLAAQLLAPIFSYMCARGEMENAASVADMLGAQKSIQEIVAYCGEIEQSIFVDAVQENAQEGNIVRIIEGYAISRLNEDLSLQSMAAMLHYNPAYLSRMFKNVAGVNYSTWISDLRLAEAKKLMRNDGFKIQDISERLGFESPSYFTRFFKKKTGISPAKWRARNEA